MAGLWLSGGMFADEGKFKVEEMLLRNYVEARCAYFGRID